MGHFAWFATVSGDPSTGLTDALRDKIAQQVQEELQLNNPANAVPASTVPGSPSPPFLPISPVDPMTPGLPKKKMYLTSSGDWDEYRHHAHPFKSKEDAEAAAFNLTARQPELLGKIGVEKLWLEPPEINFRSGGRDYFVPAFRPSMSEYLTAKDKGPYNPLKDLF